MGFQFIAFTASGPLIGWVGLTIDLPAMFWIGIAVCAVNLFMNLASGVMKLPVLPGVLIVGGMLLWKPWLVGAALGLLLWTTVESFGELVSMLRRK